MYMFQEGFQDLNSPDTLTEDSYNEFYILLHANDDVPLFQGPVDTKIALKEKNNGDYVKEYRVPFTVTVSETDNILEKYSFRKRMCRFKHELGEMKIFQKYTKQI